MSNIGHDEIQQSVICFRPSVRLSVSFFFTFYQHSTLDAGYHSHQRRRHICLIKVVTRYSDEIKIENKYTEIVHIFIRYSNNKIVVIEVCRFADQLLSNQTMKFCTSVEKYSIQNSTRTLKRNERRPKQATQHTWLKYDLVHKL